MFQDCPLSPLLFAIAMKLSAVMIIRSSGITGFKQGPMKVKLVLYANDVILSLGVNGYSLKNYYNFYLWPFLRVTKC